MRAGRLLALLLWLQQRGGGATAAEMATELEVSVRTIYRDVAALQGAGVPLWTETGPGGGVRLLEGWRTRLDGLSGDEAGSLFLAGAGTAAAELGLGTVLASAQTKLLATLPPELRRRAARVRSRFLLDAPSWFSSGESPSCLATVADAVWSDRRLRITYGRRDGDVRRTVDPLGLVVKGGIWYLVAGVGGGARTYRVSRITAAEATGERSDRPDGFDLATWWRVSAAAFNQDILRGQVTVRLSAAASRLLPHVTDEAAARAALEAATPDGDDGWVTVDLAVESEEVAHSQLLALGAGVEVLSPPALRAALAATAREVAARNS